MSAALAGALAAIDTWPVPTAAAVVIGSDGVLAAHGPLEHEFALASLTKPLAGLAMLVAVEEEAIGLQASADDQLLPGATLRHLLAHASGLAPERRLRSFPPAVRRVYSNVGIELAAQLVAAAVEMPFETYLHEAVCAPLGMTGTRLAGSPARDGISTAADLAVLLHAVLCPGRLLHPSTLRQASSVQYPGLRGVLPGFGPQQPNDWGLTFEIRANKSPHWTGTTNSAATFGHFGQSGTMAWVDPSRDVALVALADRPFDDWARLAWPRLSDAVLSALGDR